MDERFDNMYIQHLQCEKLSEKILHFLKLHFASFLIGFRVGKGWANPITVGPLATDPKARGRCDFKLILFLHFVYICLELWKEKTQLRKFADARICECMIWADTTSMAVPYSILQFIVANHFNLPAECISWRSALPTEFLSRRDVNVNITSAFAGLSAILRSAKGLPLMITNIQAVIYLKLEYSGKWGDTIDGVLHLSAAFYIEDGVAFKLVLVLDKVLKILERRVAEMKSNGVSQMEMTRLQASLHSCATKYIAYGETVQILKRYDLSLKFCCFFFLTAFLHCFPCGSIFLPRCSIFPLYSTTSLAAFRRVLELICRHNWTARPLLIDFDNAWDEKEIANLEEKFVKMRPILPPMVIITNEDPTGARYVLRCYPASEYNFWWMSHIFNTIFCALPVLNFDPVDDFVCALNAHFQHVALFFWNKYGGDRIGIKWKPHEIDVPAKFNCSNSPSDVFPNNLLYVPNVRTASLNFDSNKKNLHFFGRIFLCKADFLKQLIRQPICLEGVLIRRLTFFIETSPFIIMKRKLLLSSIQNQGLAY
ncbi:unnamed protein product [Angiostrongylus costaricensis]|uniref:Nucleolar protein 6 n=1 Tax=Angiostrongylus costaricensis TaxID=334426 RepID=A0A0R3PAH9_ANGCS|nr:unnamed protein product [Angiostrongylus costaricensis]